MQKFNLKLITPVIPALIISSCSVAAVEHQDATCHKVHHEDQLVKELDQVFNSMRFIVGTLNKALQDFFSRTNPDGLVVRAGKIEKIKLQTIQMVEDLRKKTKGHEASAELISYADSFIHQFNVFVGVVDEFKHKPATHAMAFATKLENKINIKKIFSDIITKLDRLQTKYATKDRAFADHLSTFMRFLRTIVGQWDKKDRAKMFDDIVFVMSKK